MGISIFTGPAQELVIRFVFNIFVAFILIRYIYTGVKLRATYVFTFIMFNTLIFFITYLLSNVTLSIGFAFGLFAVFSILRYRTDPIPIKEMTYLFAAITLGVMNALITPEISIIEVILANVAIVAVAFALEKMIRGAGLDEMVIIYEKIENIHHERQAELLEDIEKRTGLTIHDHVIERVDFLRDVARIRIHYLANSDKK